MKTLAIVAAISAMLGASSAFAADGIKVNQLGGNIAPTLGVQLTGKIVAKDLRGDVKVDNVVVSVTNSAEVVGAKVKSVNQTALNGGITVGVQATKGVDVKNAGSVSIGQTVAAAANSINISRD